MNCDFPSWTHFGHPRSRKSAAERLPFASHRANLWCRSSQAIQSGMSPSLMRYTSGNRHPRSRPFRFSERNRENPRWWVINARAKKRQQRPEYARRISALSAMSPRQRSQYRSLSLRWIRKSFSHAAIIGPPCRVSSAAADAVHHMLIGARPVLSLPEASQTRWCVQR